MSSQPQQTPAAACLQLGFEPPRERSGAIEQNFMPVIKRKGTTIWRGAVPKETYQETLGLREGTGIASCPVRNLPPAVLPRQDLLSRNRKPGDGGVVRGLWFG
jgi:hypothetical protein